MHRFIEGRYTSASTALAWFAIIILGHSVYSRLLHSPDCPLLQKLYSSFNLQWFKVRKHYTHWYLVDLWKSEVIVLLALFPSCHGFFLRFFWKKFYAFILKATFHLSVSTDQVMRCHVWTPWRLRREPLTSPQKIVNCSFLLADNTFDSICMKLNLLIKMDIIVQILENPFLICYKLYNCQIFMV